MASRVISIKVVYENREALVAARAQAIANKAVADAARASALAAQKLATEEQKTAKASAQAALAQQKLATSLQQTKDKADSQSRSFASLITYTAKLYGSFQLVSKTVGLVSNEMSLAFSSAYRLQQSMTLLGAAGSLTAEQMASVRGTIHDLSRAFPVAQEEVAQGALELVRMGYTGKELENVLGAVTKASIIMGSSVADAGQAMFTASNIFGYTSTQAEEVALSLQQIGVAMNYTAGTAKTAGVALEPVLAMMATLRNLGVGASTIGTSMRTFFRELSAGGKAVKAIGGDINSLGLAETLNRFSKLDPRTFADLFSKPASSALQLFQSEILKTGNSYEKFMEQLTGEGAQKAFDEASKRFGQDLPGAVQLFRNAMTELADAVSNGGVIGKPLIGLVNTFTDLAQRLSLLNKVVASPFDSMRKLSETAILQNLAAQNPGFGPLPAGFNPNTGKSAYTPGESKGLPKEAADAEEAIKALEAAYKKWQNQIENMELKGHAQDVELTKKQYLSYAAQFEKLGEIGSANDALRERLSLIKDQSKELEKVHKAAIALGEAAGDATEAAWGEALKQANMDLRTTALRIDELGAGITGNEWGKLGELQGGLESLSKLYFLLGQEDKVEKIEQLQTALKDLAKSSALFAPEWGTRFMEMATGIDMATLAVNNLNGAADSLSSKLSNDLVSSVAGVKTAYIEWGEIGKQIAVKLIADLISLSIRFAVLQAITATNPAAGSFLAFAGNQFGGKFASGGTKTVRQPTSFLAGEAGKEKVTVTPRSRVNRDNGGGDIIVQINGDVYGAEKFNEAVAVANKRKVYV
jgi:TP901 family phage tail tape measure protein